MAGLLQHTNRLLIRTAGCGLAVVAMTGCSVFQSDSHLVEVEPGVSVNAIASADQGFVAEPFSLVAADSVGLATFGVEIAHWADLEPVEQLAQQ